MSKNAPQVSVLTANRLGDGVVVFLDCEGDWVELIGAGAVARTPEEVRALEARGAHDAARNLVVEPYLVEVRDGPGGVTPVRTRERVRVAGPSILGDVPGYVSPAAPSPRASPTPPRSHAPAPHPDPLPIVKNDGERESHAEAA
jgi:hypothetical protein